MRILTNILVAATLAMAAGAAAQDAPAADEPLTFTNDDLQQAPEYDAAEDAARSEEHKRRAAEEAARAEAEAEKQPAAPSGTMVRRPDGRQVEAVSWPEGDAQTRARLARVQGQPATALQVGEWLNGNAVDVSGTDGRIVVLDFWATWCGPCLQSVPHTNELAAKYADKGVVFVGVCATKGAEKMKDTVIRAGIKYPVCADAQDRTAIAYAVDGYPDYYIVDHTGTVAMADVRADAVEVAIQAMIAKRGRAAAEALATKSASQ